MPGLAGRPELASLLARRTVLPSAGPKSVATPQARMPNLGRPGMPGTRKEIHKMSTVWGAFWDCRTYQRRPSGAIQRTSVCHQRGKGLHLSRRAHDVPDDRPCSITAMRASSYAGSADARTGQCRANAIRKRKPTQAGTMIVSRVASATK